MHCYIFAAFLFVGSSNLVLAGHNLNSETKDYSSADSDCIHPTTRASVLKKYTLHQRHLKESLKLIDADPEIVNKKAEEETKKFLRGLTPSENLFLSSFFLRDQLAQASKQLKENPGILDAITKYKLAQKKHKVRVEIYRNSGVTGFLENIFTDKSFEELHKSEEKLQKAFVNLLNRVDSSTLNPDQKKRLRILYGQLNINSLHEGSIASESLENRYRAYQGATDTVLLTALAISTVWAGGLGLKMAAGYTATAWSGTFGFMVPAGAEIMKGAAAGSFGGSFFLSGLQLGSGNAGNIIRAIFDSSNDSFFCSLAKQSRINKQLLLARTKSAFKTGLIFGGMSFSTGGLASKYAHDIFSLSTSKYTLSGLLSFFSHGVKGLKALDITLSELERGGPNTSTISQILDASSPEEKLSIAASREKLVKSEPEGPIMNRIFRGASDLKSYLIEDKKIHSLPDEKQQEIGEYLDLIFYSLYKYYRLFGEKDHSLDKLPGILLSPTDGSPLELYEDELKTEINKIISR